MIALLSTALAGSICSTNGLPSGPVAVDLRPGALGAVADPCVRTEAAVRAGGSLLVDRPDFYGRLGVFSAVDLRLGLSERTEVFARVEPFRSDTVIAPVQVEAAGLGASTLGVRTVVEQDETHVFSLHGQVLLPTQPGVNARAMGLDLGASVARSTPWGELHGGLTLAGRTMLGRGPADERVALGGQVGLTRRLGERAAVLLDLPASVGFGGGLDHLALAGALRLGAGGTTDRGARGLFCALALTAPLVGEDRTLLAGSLRVGYRTR